MATRSKKSSTDKGVAPVTPTTRTPDAVAPEAVAPQSAAKSPKREAAATAKPANVKPASAKAAEPKTERRATKRETTKAVVAKPPTKPTERRAVARKKSTDVPPIAPESVTSPQHHGSDQQTSQPPGFVSTADSVEAVRTSNGAKRGDVAGRVAPEFDSAAVRPARAPRAVRATREAERPQANDEASTTSTWADDAVYETRRTMTDAETSSESESPAAPVPNEPTPQEPALPAPETPSTPAPEEPVTPEPSTPADEPSEEPSSTPPEIDEPDSQPSSPTPDTPIPQATSATDEEDEEQSRELLTEHDTYLFHEGSHYQLWKKLGSHLTERDGVAGTAFAVWAPNARSVSVIGEFNGWNNDAHPMTARGQSGIWEAFIPKVGKGTKYKYHIVSLHNGYRVDKADPFGVMHETPPATASIVWDLEYEWNDAEWMKTRSEHNAFSAPQSIYEVHLGSWRRVPEEGNRSMTYREIAAPLAEYVKKMNFTHVELLPLMEHPFYGSWGYQVTGFFAPTSRFGTPQDLKYLIDVLHENGIAVILDWVPSHFPTDEHGLGYFDGTHLFEHADPRKGFHPDWSSLIFNYGRNEVRSFLLSSALYWLGEYHVDALRVDAVASMLYLDYSRKAGEWIPNEFGGRENVEAISFLRRLNEDVYKEHPDVQVIAEESTAWPMVSRPTYIGGLGFGLKWDMGWMHDTLRYFSYDSIYRKFHHTDLTFRMMYAFTENFVLPLSHDEVVHGKGSLINKMAGDEWQKFANLRLLYAHMFSQPGKKLLFMGCEFGQVREWNHDASLEWHLLESPRHASLARWFEDLNKFYRDVPAMHELDLDPAGFEWIDCCDTENSVVALMRRSRTKPDQFVVAVLNFTSVPRYNYQVGVPRGGYWTEALNSDAAIYGGSAQGNLGGVDAAPIPLHGRRWSMNVTLPPLGAVFFLSEGNDTDVPAGLKSAEPGAESERDPEL